MRKISQIIKMGADAQAKAVKGSFAYDGLCFTLNDLRKQGSISLDEYHMCKNYIFNKVLAPEGCKTTFVYLSHKLKAQKKASNLSARVAFYHRLAVKLEKKGL
jgi:hypothetical protein